MQVFRSLILFFSNERLGGWGATEQFCKVFHNCSVAPQTPYRFGQPFDENLF